MRTECRYCQYALSHPDASAGFLITWLPYTEIGEARDAYLNIIKERLKP